jgi:hypothetical protein
MQQSIHPHRECFTAFLQDIAFARLPDPAWIEQVMNGGSGAGRSVNEIYPGKNFAPQGNAVRKLKRSRSAASLAENRRLRGEAPFNRLIIHFLNPFMNIYSFRLSPCDATKSDLLLKKLSK